jgi:hypothetical protein
MGKSLMQADSDVLNELSGPTYLPTLRSLQTKEFIPALYAATATKIVQAATVNKSLHFRRRLRDFFAPVWGLPLVAVYVPVRDKIRSEKFRCLCEYFARFGGALKALC